MTRTFAAFTCFLGLSVVAAGCAAEGEDIGSETAAAVSGPAALNVSLTILESKIVFSSKVDAFAINDGGALALPCRDRSFSMSSKPSLHGGWSPDKAADFSEDVAGTEFREYEFAACRDGQTEVLGWFPHEREFEFIVSEQLLDEDYDPVKMPLILQFKKIGTDDPTYYNCNSAFKKTQVGETANAKKFDISVSCKPRAKPSKKQLGQIDFIENPGPYAAVASWRDWQLPAVASNKTNFDKVKTAFLAKVPAGNYGGAMRTLDNKCDLSIEKSGDMLIVDHTIVSSDRTRHFELEAEDLLGFTEGDLFKDPNRVGGDPVGTFVAAEFRDKKGGSFVMRFEKNDGLDAQVMRINGSESFCRRLEKK